MLLIPVALLATILGLLSAAFIPISQQFGWALLLISLVGGFLMRQRPPALLFCLFGFFFLLAQLRYPLQFPNGDFLSWVDSQNSKLEVTAEVLQLRQLSAERSQMELQILQVVDRGRAVDGSGCRMRLYLNEPVTDLWPGDQLKFRSRLRRPRLFGIPGEFHWPRHLASKGIALTGWVKSAEQLTLIARGRPSLARLVAKWREAKEKRIEGCVEQRQGALLRALLLGEGKLLPDSLRRQLAAAGVSHLFAISGLHLGLLGLLGYRLMLNFYRRIPPLLVWQPPQRVLPLLLLPLLFFYLLVTGDAVSTRRAFCVAAIVPFLWGYRYHVNPLRLLAALALLFLLVNPLLLWQPAWQLSFSGAAGILLWRPLWQDKTAGVTPLVRTPLRLLLVTLAATLATLPWVLADFHLLSPAGLVANLIAVPLVAMVALPMGLVALALPWPLLAGVGFSLSGAVLEFTLTLLEQVLKIPAFESHYLFLNRWQYLAICLLLLPLLLVWQKSCYRHFAMLLGSCLLLALLCETIAWQQPSGISLYLFSVGQGESMLLINAERQAVLIDGGGLYSDRFDVGERLLAPALGELGVRHLDAVLLSHDHPDHRKGLLFLLEQFSVDQFWTGEAPDHLHPSLRQVLRQRAIPVRSFAAGWSPVQFWRSGRLQVYSRPEKRNRNDSSLVLYLRYAADGLLLTGDLEAKGVDRLLAMGIPGPVTVLKLPHHGSKHSHTERLLRLLQPDIGLVSAGYRNRYRFPAEILVRFMAGTQTPLYRTDTMGTIRVAGIGEGKAVFCWRNGVFR